MPRHRSHRWGGACRGSCREARFDPPPNTHTHTPSVRPFGQLSMLVIQAMGLCAGFAAADFKPICWEKIGLVYQPRFIVHILFVNPTNYIYFPIAIALSLSLFFVNLFSLFCPHKRVDNRHKTKGDAAARVQQTSGIAAPGYKMQDRRRNANKGTALCSEGESREALRGRSCGLTNSRHLYHKAPASFALTSRDSDQFTHRFWTRGVGVSKMEKKRKNNKESLGADWPSRTSMAAPTIIT